VVCEHCTLKYTIYGVFAFCPDCRTHNSLQILTKNLEITVKLVEFSTHNQSDLATQLVGDALANAVSSFDGFGRETCRVHAARATTPAKAENISFQSLSGARTNFLQLFGKDFARNIDASDWEFTMRCFQKRHLLAHKMGVVDEAYLRTTNDTSSTEGRKVRIEGDEVKRLAACVQQLGRELIACF
jgi:hypothetical protein